MTSLQSFRRQAGAAVVLALTLLACGNSSSSPPPPPPAGAPSVTAVAPASGPARGGTTLTISGTGFVTGATVKIGDAVVAGPTVASATSITCTTPAHGAGAGAVVVTNPDGQASGSATSFTYVAGPLVSSVAPGIVPTTGGAVLIQGSDFAGPVTVRFGGVVAQGVQLVSASQISATAPAHAGGLVDVLVQNGDGQQATLARALNYSDASLPPPATAAPTLASVSPTSGPDTGGTAVTLAGTNFDAGTTVSFGGATATVVSVTATALGVVTPLHADGAVDVKVANGSGSATLPGAYTYLAPPPVTPPPVLSTVSPARGSVTGGTVVTLAGSAFAQPTVTFTVLQAGSPVTLFATVLSTSPTSLTVSAPPSPTQGVASVTVTNLDGQASTQANAFTYVAPPPVVTALTPSSGPAGAATGVTITGSGFANGATVSFGSAPATNVAVQGPTSITVASPASAAGTVNVTVTNLDGQSSVASNASAFTFLPGGGLPAPVIADMTPRTAVLTGGQPFTITGSNFLGGATVTIGGAPALNLVVGNTGVQITGTIPPGAAGPAPVVVRNVDGQTATFNLFSYVNPPPQIVALNVEGQPVAGGLIQIAGNGFSANATVTFGGVPSPSVAQDPTTKSLVVSVPPYAGALDPTFQDAFVSLVVTNPDLQSTTWSKQFHYGPPPSITGLAASPGGIAVVKKGDTITVTGANFSADATGIRSGIQVAVSGTPVTPTSKTSTQLVFAAPKMNPGTYPVIVTNFDKQFTSSGPLQLTYPGP